MQYRTTAAFWDGDKFYELGAVAEFPESVGAALVRSGKAEAFTAPASQPKPAPEPAPEPSPETAPEPSPETARSRKPRRAV